jgi:hypothetical protein
VLQRYRVPFVLELDTELDFNSDTKN